MKTEILTNMLKELLECIDGPYFLSDGGLLGLVREGQLLKHDNDLDLYLLPGTKINIPDDHPTLAIMNYYMDKKVYRKNIEKHKTNKWLEFLSYLRVLPETNNMNRAELFKFGKLRYYEESILKEYSLPYIDIFHLEKQEDTTYHIPYWTTFNSFKYFKEEVELLQVNNQLGFDVTIPNNAEHILQRQYGDNWETCDPNFQY